MSGGVIRRGGDLKVVQKDWGWETWIVNNDLYCGKLLTIMPGFQCSLHFHPVKHETFHVLEGRIELDLENKMKDVRRGHRMVVMHKGDSITLPPWTPHRFRVPKGHPQATLVEFSTRHDDEDVIRLEPSREL